MKILKKSHFKLSKNQITPKKKKIMTTTTTKEVTTEAEADMIIIVVTMSQEAEVEEEEEVAEEATTNALMRTKALLESFLKTQTNNYKKVWKTILTLEVIK